VEDIHDAGEANGVDGPVRVAVLIVYDFENASPTKAPERLDAGMLIAVLRVIDCKAHHATNFVREGPKIILGRPDP
jgi:hypothetical protein